MPGEQPDVYAANGNGARISGVSNFVHAIINFAQRHALLRLNGWLFVFTIVAALNFLALNTGTAHAQDGAGLVRFFVESLESNQVLMLAIFGGAMSFALLSASWLIRERTQLVSTNQRLKDSLADLRASNDRNEALVNTADQRIVVWNGGDDNAIVLGSLPSHCGAPGDSSQFLKFAAWLEPAHAPSFERQVNELRLNAIGFETVIKSRGGGLIEVIGSTSASYAFIKFRDLKGVREGKARLEADYNSLNSSFAKIEALLLDLPAPAWLKDRNGKLVWVNRSYAEAIESGDPQKVVESNLDLFDSEQREEIENQGNEEGVFDALVPATVAGDRKKLQVFSKTVENGSAGIAFDKSDVDEVRRMLREANEGHSRMLDHLATAVAIFDKSQRLVFYNNGFQQLWKLDPSVLDTNPSHADILDSLRDGKLLPEHPDWRKWREGQLEIYKAIEPVEEWWHLLDGQTIRVVASPRNEGGSTWIFENVTERLALESNYNALMRVQGETLDHLKEAVAVFGSNGQLKLFNPALEELWSEADISVQEGIHIAAIIDGWTETVSNQEDLEKILGAVTGFDDIRRQVEGRMQLSNGNFLNYSLVPLPEGQSMLTFVDITASVNFEQALKDRAEALEASDHLKSRFIQHVSYELRAPLTSISGFGEMLADTEFGKLNQKQGEYLAHINEAAVDLRKIVDDILDLASIDAGTMSLQFADVHLDELVEHAFEELSEGMAEKGLKALVDISEESENIIADRTRVLQVFANLLSNAINFSPDGGQICVVATRVEDMHEIRISDQGPGIDQAELQVIFERFETRSPDGKKMGTGLGLSIVRSLVELHGGQIWVDPEYENGTCFVCRLPINPSVLKQPDLVGDDVIASAA